MFKTNNQTELLRCRFSVYSLMLVGVL